ncbi:hypothetical protein NKH77_48415 [Streptomyces sp. M19]
MSQLMRWNRVMSRMRFLIAADAWLVHRALLEHIVGTPRAARSAAGRSPPGRSTRTPSPRPRGPGADGGRGDRRVSAAHRGRLHGAGDRRAEVVLRGAGHGVRRAVHRPGGRRRVHVGQRRLRAHAQLRGFRMAGGSQTTMLTIANHSLACRAELGTGPAAQAPPAAPPTAATGAPTGGRADG